MTFTPSSPALPATPRDVGTDIAAPPRSAPEPRGDGLQEARHEDLVRYLEDRFACAQACDECVRTCAARQGPADPGAMPRLNSVCADVCDATARVLSEQSDQDEQRVRIQVEWCRAVCFQCASLCDLRTPADRCVEACRRCVRACDVFLATLG
ncbi:ferredoxin [Streptomyces sp. NPDC059002]|uniref:ferredoxin n=1 Tax=Streptomyces sp. NPDC059002 TaxID=3346690 RepID=UPI00368C3BF6